MAKTEHDVDIFCQNCTRHVGYIRAGEQLDGTYIEFGVELHAKVCNSCVGSDNIKTSGLEIVELEAQRRQLLGID